MMLNLKVLFLFGLALPLIWTLSAGDKSKAWRNKSSWENSREGYSSESIEHSQDHKHSKESRSQESQDHSKDQGQSSESHSQESNDNSADSRHSPNCHNHGGINHSHKQLKTGRSHDFGLSPQHKEDQCSSPSGKGLSNLFKESMKLLPLQGIKEIVESYANDTEVKALKKFINSTEYRQKVKAIRNSEEYKILKAYACHVLHIELAELRDYITTYVLRSASPTTGIRNLLHKIYSILPQQKLKDLFNDQMKSDEELVKAAAHLKSTEFQQMLINIRNNVPACKALRKKLAAIGVPLDEIRGLVGGALGWQLDFDAVA